MKQHITAKQLNELGEKGKDRLRKWWEPEEGNWYLDEDECQMVVWCCEDDVKETDLPLLSIGQMIEFLGEKWKDELFVSDWADSSIGTYYLPVRKIYEGKLCDTLWQAVKEVLEK